MQVPVASLVGKKVGLYFSAQWWVTCVKFIPRLISIYQKIKQMPVENGDHEDFEIVFVSNDHDQESFDSYFNTMPWPLASFAFWRPNCEGACQAF